MEFYTCKGCGEDIEVEDGQKTAVCGFCGMEQTLPVLNDPKKLEMLLNANDRRIRCRFDIAKKLYEQVIEQYPDDNEAYWCKLLCEYGIEYVEDDLTEKNIPTCHRTITESIFDNYDYRFIMSRATAEERAIYEAEAREIDRIQKDIIAKAQQAESYDIFICYKESDIESRKRTIDSQYATKIYTHLTNNGYKVFFSRVTLNQMMGSEYEPVIYSALKSAKVMLHVTTSEANTNSPWVRNEWSRYLEFMREDPSKILMPCIAKMDPYDLPEELSAFQVAFVTDLDFVENLLRQLNSKFGRMPMYGMQQPRPTPPPQPTPQPPSSNPQVVNMVNRAKLFVEDKDWESANKFAENCLDIDCECAEAYIVKLMCDFKVDVLHKLVKNREFLTNRNYVKALRFASGELKTKLENMEVEYWTDMADEASDADLLNDEFYKTITEKLKSFGSCRGADKLLTELYKKRELAKKYDTALTLINSNLRNEEIYQKAEECLKSLGRYKDAEELLESLPQKREEMCFSMELSQDGKYYILKYVLDKNVESFIIPSIYKGLPVKEIGRYAFNDCKSLTSIEIPASVTSIGEYAFGGCYNLASIEIPASVTSIGNSAFSHCSILTSIEIPDSVIGVGNSAFWACYKLTIYCEATSQHSDWEEKWNSQNLPVVWDCKNNNIADDGYMYGISVDGINYAIKDGEAKVVGTNASGDKAIQSSIIYNSTTYAVTSIGEYAFGFCDNLTSIEIPDSIIIIEENAFCECKSLTSIEIPDSVTSIGEYAFSRCSSLTCVEIPQSVTGVGKYAFSGCYKLTIYCEATSQPSDWEEEWNSSNSTVVWDCKNNNVADDGYMYGITVDGINYAIKDGEVKVAGTNARGNVVIPSSITYKSKTYEVTSLGSRVFYDCRSLTSIEIPDSVTSLGEYALSGCSKLTSIEIPDSVTSLGSRVFYDCRSLTSIEIPDSVTSIEYGAFEQCISLISIKIPDSVTSIESYAFSCCRKLTIYCEVASKPSGWNSKWNPSNHPVVWDCKNNNIADDGYIYGITVDGINYAIKDGEAKVAGTNARGDIAIPGSITYKSKTYEVTSIGEGSFYDCRSLTTIEIPSSVTSIGESAFNGCSSLTSIEIPDSVTSIGSYAFYGCTSLISIEIPDSVKSIEKRAFSYCTSLTRIEIPYSVKCIGEDAFSGCSNLTSVEIPYSVTSIEKWAFSYCKNLTRIEIPDSVTTIGSCAFKECDNLTIYCEATSKPSRNSKLYFAGLTFSGWDDKWNDSNRPVVWGYRK